jgi:hypothetical protein
VINSNTGTLFTGDLTPTVSIDDAWFFGSVSAPVTPRGTTSVQPDTALVPEPETGLLVVLGLAILAARNPRGLRR